MKAVNLAIIGATGLVGQTTLRVFEEWNIPLKSLRLFASANSSGKELDFRNQKIKLEVLESVPRDIEVAIFAASKEIAKEWVPQFREAGIMVIDHSAQFRQDNEVPLVIPEINGNRIADHIGLIANPNCAATVGLLPLAALKNKFGLKTVVMDTFQSVSGSGLEALNEYESQLKDSSYPAKIYPRQIAHNIFPQVGAFLDNGLCEEEQKVIWETRKILEDQNLAVFPTTTRVPVRIGHSIAVTAELKNIAKKNEIEAVFLEMSGMIYESNTYKTPLEIAGLQETFVSRLRLHEDSPNWIQFWATNDNLRKGAASNAVQILMELYKL